METEKFVEWKGAVEKEGQEVDDKSTNKILYKDGYRDIYKDVSLFHKLMIIFCDSLVKMQIIKITFR